MRSAPSLCQNFLLKWEVVNNDSPKNKDQWRAHSYSITPSRFRDNFGKWAERIKEPKDGKVFPDDEFPEWCGFYFHELMEAVPA